MSTPNTFDSNKVARELCDSHGLSQCVIIGFSPDREYEIVAAGVDDENAAIAAKVANALKSLIQMSVDAKHIKVVT